MIVFTAGGWSDIRAVFGRLSTLQRDESDDGWVDSGKNDDTPGADY